MRALVLRNFELEALDHLIVPSIEGDQRECLPARSELVIRREGHCRMVFSIGQLAPQDDDSFGLGGAAQFRVERRQRQSAPQREFQVRRIVQSKAMALR